MNEPHDLTVATVSAYFSEQIPIANHLPGEFQWVDTVQAVVTAIRAVAPDNYLLLPGSSYSNAATFPTEAGPLLVKVTNPSGDTDNLIFDLHKYLGKRLTPETEQRWC